MSATSYLQEGTNEMLACSLSVGHITNVSAASHRSSDCQPVFYLQLNVTAPSNTVTPCNAVMLGPCKHGVADVLCINQREPPGCSCQTHLNIPALELVDVSFGSRA